MQLQEARNETVQLMTDLYSDADLYRRMALIRRFEETVLEKFSQGVFYGTTHTYLGQEANAVGALAGIVPGDVVVSNHRCHGHFLAYGGDPRALFAELMGRASGVCGGRGGSQHLHWQDFYSNGILGGMVPIATGMGLAEKFKSSGKIAVAFLGDGALGEGIVYEALNMASLWGAPVLYVLENNHIAQTTPVERAVAGDIAARFTAFGIETAELDTCDVRAILEPAVRLMAAIRFDSKPRALVLHTSRFGPHSKGDDTRPAEEIARLRRDRDPLTVQAARLVSSLTAMIKTEVSAEVERAYQAALADPWPLPEPVA